MLNLSSRKVARTPKGEGFLLALKRLNVFFGGFLDFFFFFLVVVVEISH